jgi:hypothetical protein
MKSCVHHTLTKLHHKVFAVGAFWDGDNESDLSGFGRKRQSTQACNVSVMNEGWESLMDNLGST